MAQSRRERMRPDLEAAQRLAATLPVHTHERVIYSHVQGCKIVPPILVGHLKFRSRLEIRRHYRIGAATLEEWLRAGRAKFL